MDMSSVAGVLVRLTLRCRSLMENLTRPIRPDIRAEFQGGSRGSVMGRLSSLCPPCKRGRGAQVEVQSDDCTLCGRTFRVRIQGPVGPPCLGDLKVVTGNSRLMGAGTKGRPSPPNVWTASR